MCERCDRRQSHVREILRYARVPQVVQNDFIKHLESSKDVVVRQLGGLANIMQKSTNIFQDKSEDQQLVATTLSLETISMMTLFSNFLLQRLSKAENALEILSENELKKEQANVV